MSELVPWPLLFAAAVPGVVAAIVGRAARRRAGVLAGASLAFAYVAYHAWVLFTVVGASLEIGLGRVVVAVVLLGFLPALVSLSSGLWTLGRTRGTVSIALGACGVATLAALSTIVGNYVTWGWVIPMMVATT